MQLSKEQENIAQRLSQSMTLPALYNFRAYWERAIDHVHQDRELAIINRAIELS